jgi:polar amino acid transport system substrate-binding protein
MAPSAHLARIMEKGEFVVGTVGDMPPLNMRAKNDEIIGFEMDLAQMMADALGVKLRVQTMPFHELLPALENNQVDAVLSGMTITPARNAKYAFVGPYLKSGKAFLAKSETIANASDAAEVNSPSTKVVALKGSTSQRFVELVMPKAQLTLTDNYDDAIRLVLTDQVHALVADYPVCIVSLFRYPTAGFISINTTLTYEPYGIALPPNDPHLINWVQNFLGIFRGSGNLNYLKEKWLENGDWIDRIN